MSIVKTDASLKKNRKLKIVKMVRLFISDRILIDGSFYNGGIVVNSDGKIENVFKIRAQVDEWLESASNVEVNFIFANQLQK